MTSAWRLPPRDIALSDPDVHVWRAVLDVEKRQRQALGRLLADDERARAARFRFDRDRDRYVVGRGLLREILARYGRERPEALRFRYSPHGKPHLVSPAGGPGFNVSHSHGVALFAVTSGRRIGVDVERIDPEFATESIARRFFSSTEAESLRRVTGDDRNPSFFRVWTRKESWVKAIGEGLSVPLADFDVSVTPGEARLLAVRHSPEDPERWTMRELDAFPGFAATVVVEGRISRLACWTLEERV